jgi:predicted PhzF superfamily epimerase YddE/YHI9
MVSLASQLEKGEAQGLVVMQAVSANAEQVPTVLDRRADYQLRFFAPGLGIPEDPVTGSAHALVAPYWMQICGRSDVVGWQCSPRPGGMVCERVEADRIQITGSAYRLLKGTINLDAPPSPMGWELP